VPQQSITLDARCRITLIAILGIWLFFKGLRLSLIRDKMFYIAIKCPRSQSKLAVRADVWPFGGMMAGGHLFCGNFADQQGGGKGSFCRSGRVLRLVGWLLRAASRAGAVGRGRLAKGRLYCDQGYFYCD
jgi:hypothetical protein